MFSRQMKCFNTLLCNKIIFHIFRTDIWVAEGCCCWWQLSPCPERMLQVQLSQKSCWVRQNQFVLQLAEKLCCPCGAWSKAGGKLFQSWALSVEEMTSACIVLYLFWESLQNSLHRGWQPHVPHKHCNFPVIPPMWIEAHSEWIAGKKDGNCVVLVEAL